MSFLREGDDEILAMCADLDTGLNPDTNNPTSSASGGIVPDPYLPGFMPNPTLSGMYPGSNNPVLLMDNSTMTINNSEVQFGTKIFASAEASASDASAGSAIGASALVASATRAGAVNDIKIAGSGVGGDTVTLSSPANGGAANPALQINISPNNIQHSAVKKPAFDRSLTIDSIPTEEEDDHDSISSPNNTTSNTFSNTCYNPTTNTISNTFTNDFTNSVSNTDFNTPQNTNISSNPLKLEVGRGGSNPTRSPSPRPLTKAFSSPVTPSTETPRTPLFPPSTTPGPSTTPLILPTPNDDPNSTPGIISNPGATYLNSIVHHGTQIVVTYNNCVGSKDTPSPAEEGAIGGGGSAPLQEFKSILQRRYRQRSQSPLLPWHLGATVAPLSHYYLEPRISGVDRRGHPTPDTISITHLLTASHQEMAQRRFLVEGEAGMGKTLLAAHLAQRWAEESDCDSPDGLSTHFGLVLLVSLADYNGSLEQYLLTEILPSYFPPEQFRQVWDYWKRHEKDILFILDGYDELGKFEKCEVQNLIHGQDFPNSCVLVTSRPTTLQSFVAKRLVVKGFDENQMWKFISKYFDVVKDSSCGASLQDILVRHNKYRKLAERPLFCVLLCMLYETTESARKELPDRMSDMLYKIMLCLIKWRKARARGDPASIQREETSDENVAPNVGGFPPNYEEAFDSFGQVCVQALKNDRHRFTDENVKNVPHFEDIRNLGFLYTADESDVLRVQVQKFLKPVHQVFVEYLAALHISNHVKKCLWGCRKCWKFSSLLERKDSEVLIFTAGILGENAHRLFAITRFPKLQKLPEMQLLDLLREARPHNHNKKVIASLLDRESVVITTNETDLEGWTHLLPENFYYFKTLEIIWRIKSSNPDQESSFVEASAELLSAFFAALHKNTSVQNIKIRAKQDGAIFTDDKLEIFFAELHRAFLKKGLRNLEFRDMKIDLGKHLRHCFMQLSNQPNPSLPQSSTVSTSNGGGLADLRSLKLSTFLTNDDLCCVCDTLRQSAPRLDTLHLDGLELGHTGFSALAKLLRTSGTLKHLYLSMNKALLVNVFGSICDNETNISTTTSCCPLKKNNTTTTKKKKNKELALQGKCSAGLICGNGETKNNSEDDPKNQKKNCDDLEKKITDVSDYRSISTLKNNLADNENDAQNEAIDSSNYKENNKNHVENENMHTENWSNCNHKENVNRSTENGNESAENGNRRTENVPADKKSGNYCNFAPDAMRTYYRPTRLWRNAAHKSHLEFTQHLHDNETAHGGDCTSCSRVNHTNCTVAAHCERVNHANCNTTVHCERVNHTNCIHQDGNTHTNCSTNTTDKCTNCTQHGVNYCNDNHTDCTRDICDVNATHCTAQNTGEISGSNISSDGVNIDEKSDILKRDAIHNKTSSDSFGSDCHDKSCHSFGHHCTTNNRKQCSNVNSSNNSRWQEQDTLHYSCCEESSDEDDTFDDDCSNAVKNNSNGVEYHPYKELAFLFEDLDGTFSSNSSQKPGPTSHKGSFSSDTNKRSSPASRNESDPKERSFSASSQERLVNDPPKDSLSNQAPPTAKAPMFVPQYRHYWYIKAEGGCRLPLPLCVPGSHHSVFHYLFTALPASQLVTLSLDQPALYLTVPDLVCLGDALRTAPKLATLDLQRLKKLRCYVPVLVGASMSESLECVNVSSDCITVTHPALALLCQALRHNRTIRKLDLANWRFTIDDPQSSMELVNKVLLNWKVAELNLRHCSLEFSSSNDTSGSSNVPGGSSNVPGGSSNVPGGSSNGAPSLTTLCASEAEIVMQGSAPLRGPTLLPLLSNYTSLVSLDLSGSLSRICRLNDTKCLEFFTQLGQLTHLRVLTMNHWHFELTQMCSSELANALKKCSQLRELKLHNCNEVRLKNSEDKTSDDAQNCGPKMAGMKNCGDFYQQFSSSTASPGNSVDALSNCSTSLVHTLVTSLPRLHSLSLCFYSINGRQLDEQMAQWLTSCLSRHWRHFSVTLQVFGVSPSVCAALKAGLSKGLTHLKEAKDSPPRVLTIILKRPVLPQCCYYRRPS